MDCYLVQMAPKKQEPVALMPPEEFAIKHSIRVTEALGVEWSLDCSQQHPYRSVLELFAAGGDTLKPSLDPRLVGTEPSDVVVLLSQRNKAIVSVNLHRLAFDPWVDLLSIHRRARINWRPS